MGTKELMDVVHPHAAGIDVGSKFHFVATGKQPEDIRKFGVYTEDHNEMINWLQDREVDTIAMESTGSYWQTLFFALQASGFEVLLVNGAHVKNVKGKKSDVLDCQWIQHLHKVGLLSGSFLPSAATEQLRTYHRLRNWQISKCSSSVTKMQKALRLMNFRLDIAVSDIIGKTGLAIMEAIIDGETDGHRLAALADPRVKKSKEELAAALTGHLKPEVIYELETTYDYYNYLQASIQKTELRIGALLKEMIVCEPEADQVKKVKGKRQYKSNPGFDLATLSKNYLQTDLYAIEGVSHGTVLSFISEVGTDIEKFKTAKHFTSWLRLAPNNKISGGKVLSSTTPKRKHSLALALRQAANTIGQTKSGALKSFFSRIAYKKGRAAAITATARKLAVIIWNMIVKKVPYTPLDETVSRQTVQNNAIHQIRKKMKRLNIQIDQI